MPEFREDIQHAQGGTDSCLSIAGVPAKDLEIEYITDPEGLFKIREEWEKMESLLGTPLLTIDWFLSCAQAFCPPDVLKMIAVRVNGRLGAIIPVSIKRNLVPRLELVGSWLLEEPGGVLYKDRASLAAAIHALLDLRMPVILKGFRSFSPEIQILEGELRSRHLTSLAKEEKIPWVATVGRWENFEKQISPSRRSSLRRLQRLAESKGKVRFEAITATTDNLDKYLEEVFKVEAMSWKGRTGTAMKTNPMLGKFFNIYSRRAAEQGKLHLFFLKVDEETVAVQLTVVHANRLWIYKIGHDEGWSWCSPGILLMHQVVKFCFEKGLKSCEMLGSDEPWLHIWANESHSVITFKIFPKSSKGIFGLWWYLTDTYSHGILGMLKRKMAQRSPAKPADEKKAK